MKHIVINEIQHQQLTQYLINEEVVYLGEKEKLVLSWLNIQFTPLKLQGNDKLSLPTQIKGVGVLDYNGNLTKRILSLKDTFYILQSKFKKILRDKKERDQFLWNTLNKWYNK